MYRSKNYFLKDFLNPGWVGIMILTLFLSVLGGIVVIAFFLLYASWISNVLEVNRGRLIIGHPNWIFFKARKEFALSSLEKIEANHSHNGAYSGGGYWDIYEVFLRANW
jgi:hypothetical protein